MGGHSARRENKREVLDKLSESNQRIQGKITKQKPPPRQKKAMKKA